jgi:glucose-1-phosphate thymidylyltransferase
MKALLLAGGYATRLRPLTDDRPKQLLPIAGRPMLDWILERMREVPDVDAVHLVTNSRFAADFERWADLNRVVVHDDGTRSNDDRLGAVGDLWLAIERGGLGDDDLLVLAGDNLFEYSLADFVAFWRERGAATSGVALYDCGDLALARHYGIVQTDAAGRIVDFVEKPSAPASTLAATATYLFARPHVELVPSYLGEGGSPDNSGSFVAWLAARERVYGYRFEGRWFDIGDRGQLLVADNRWRERVGLPVRDAYALEPTHI